MANDTFMDNTHTRTESNFDFYIVYISDGLLKRDLLGGRPVKQVIFRQINDISQERKKVVKSEIEFGLLFMSPEYCS